MIDNPLPLDDKEELKLSLERIEIEFISSVNKRIKLLETRLEALKRKNKGNGYY